jgi:recombination protein RecA
MFAYVPSVAANPPNVNRKEPVMADARDSKATREEREENRKEALGRAIQQIEKAYGKGTIMYLRDGQSANVDGIPTGALSLDLALGGSGVPRGRVCEIFGPESSGKTTLTLHIVAEAQKKGGAAAFIDAEHAFDPSWAKRLGVNLEDLMVNQPNCGEEALEIVEMLVRSNALDVIVVDSVAALVPRSELEGQMGDSSVGVQARLMSQAMRKLTGICAKSRTSVLFINQIREKIGVMYGSPETTPGGRALKFYSSVRIDVRRIGMLKDGETVIGSRVRAKVVKNKVAPPFREAEFDMLFEGGISREADLIDIAAEAGVLQRTGTWYSFGQTRIGQGRDNARQFLRDNPDLFEQVRAQTLQSKKPPTEPVTKSGPARGAAAPSEGKAQSSKSDTDGRNSPNDRGTTDEKLGKISAPSAAPDSGTNRRPALAAAPRRRS